MIYDTSDTVRRWSSDTFRGSSSDTFRRWSSDTFRCWSLDTSRCWSSEAVWRWCTAAKDTSNTVQHLELGCKRTPPHRNNFKHEVWHKNNKALIKAEALKGLLGHPMCKLFGFTSAILKIEDGKICCTSFQHQRPKMKNSSKESRSVPNLKTGSGATDGVLD